MKIESEVMDIPVGPVVSGSSSSWSRWLEVDDATFMQLLEEHGHDVNTVDSDYEVPRGGRGDGGEVVPLAGGWLRLAAGEDGDMVGQRVSDPVEQHLVGAPVIFGETDIEGLPGWETRRRSAARVMFFRRLAIWKYSSCRSSMRPFLQ